MNYSCLVIHRYNLRCHRLRRSRSRRRSSSISSGLLIRFVLSKSSSTILFKRSIISSCSDSRSACRMDLDSNPSAFSRSFILPDSALLTTQADKRENITKGRPAVMKRFGPVCADGFFFFLISLTTLGAVRVVWQFRKTRSSALVSGVLVLAPESAAAATP